MSKEQWRAVRGFEDYYEVSDQGRVRSRDRKTPNSLTGGENLVKGVVLKGRVNRGGYLQFTLSVAQKNTTRTAHRLVAQAFIPNPKGLPLVLHGTNGKEDNSVQNLRWGTARDNMRDKRRDGTNYHANKTHCPQKHQYSAENTTLEAGSRKCKKCASERSKKRYWEKRDKELTERRRLGLPDRLPVPKCDKCGKFRGSTHHRCLTKEEED